MSAIFSQSSHFQPCLAISSHFKPCSLIQAISSHLQPYPAISSHVQPFPGVPVVSSHFLSNNIEQKEIIIFEILYFFGCRPNQLGTRADTALNHGLTESYISRFERSLGETGGTMTMALPYRQKTMVK